MDIVIKKDKKVFKQKQYVILLLIAIPVLFAIRYLWYLNQADFSVERETLVFGEVQRGNYTVSVRGSGVLVPDNVQWLSADVDATVVRIALKAGNLVRKGDLIVELANPQLEQQYAEAKWDLEAMREEFKAAQVAQETELLTQQSTVLNTKLDYEKSVHEYKARKELIKTGAVSKLDFQKARVEMDQSEQRWHSSEKELAKMQENLAAQNKARKARLSQIEKRAERIAQQVENLQVKATMDSTVLEVPLEAGQRILMGSNLAKLARQDSLIAELQIPELQIRDVAIGQRVVVDTRNSKIEGKVSRVDPAVINGNVQVDVVFTQQLPSDARPDLSIDGEIKITEIDNTLFVERPLFAQSQSKAAFYKLTEGGNFAERIEVEVGYGSVNQIQIIAGLEVGDKIVTSDPTRFETYNKFRIN
ncbi:HlyD family secretion protein [Aliikangiella maris]|uniref:HlyD family efflux transporter periplasmic adaptor subunit n=2 Tax=Aliikangiella maris TaxID=3162458 RepID=A0ABV3MPL6_9GAMM